MSRILSNMKSKIIAILTFIVVMAITFSSVYGYTRTSDNWLCLLEENSSITINGKKANLQTASTKIDASGDKVKCDAMTVTLYNRLPQNHKSGDGGADGGVVGDTMRNSYDLTIQYKLSENDEWDDLPALYTYSINSPESMFNPGQNSCLLNINIDKNIDVGSSDKLYIRAWLDKEGSIDNEQSTWNLDLDRRTNDNSSGNSGSGNNDDSDNGVEDDDAAKSPKTSDATEPIDYVTVLLLVMLAICLILVNKELRFLKNK